MVSLSTSVVHPTVATRIWCRGTITDCLFRAGDYAQELYDRVATLRAPDVCKCMLGDALVRFAWSVLQVKGAGVSTGVQSSRVPFNQGVVGPSPTALTRGRREHAIYYPAWKMSQGHTVDVFTWRPGVYVCGRPYQQPPAPYARWRAHRGSR